MYLKIAKQRLTQLWKAAIVNSGLLTMTVLAIVLLGLAIGWREHMKGQFARLKRELNGPAPAAAPPSPQPGGQDAILLERSTIEGGSVPEFLSTTLLPGRGLNVLQIKAFVPGKGEVALLASPSLADAATLLSGKDADANGAASLNLGGAIEFPWAGRIFGIASEKDTVATTWNGTVIHLPASPENNSAAAGGLLLKTGASSAKVNVMPDGGEADVTFDPGDFDGHWPSPLTLTATAQLSGRVLELKITVRNSGEVPTPVSIGWQPRFAILNRSRGALTLRLPTQTRIESSHTGAPTGKLLSVEGTPYDFSERSGAALGSLALEDTYVHLHQAPLDNGPVAELRDPSNNFGLRMTLLSPSIKALHVSAPANGGYIAIAPRFNYDDPFGREWSREEDTGMALLQPGQLAQWRIRLEIFSLSATGF